MKPLRAEYKAAINALPEQLTQQQLNEVCKHACDPQQLAMQQFNQIVFMSAALCKSCLMHGMTFTAVYKLLGNAGKDLAFLL